MHDDESLGALLRRKRRERRLGDQPACQECGDASAMLRRTRLGALCGSCHALLRTGHATERQHVVGRANADATVACDTTLHDRLSDAQRDWPIATLRNQRSDPALREAAELRSVVDILRLLIPLLEAQAEQREGSAVHPKKAAGRKETSP